MPASATWVRAGARGANEALHLRAGDLVISAAGLFAVVYLVVAGRWAPHVRESVVAFAVISLGPPLLRAAAHRLRSRVLDLAATFWLLPAAILAHSYLGPIVDTTRPQLMDRYLALADLRLFGGHPAVLAEVHVPPWLVEILIGCYYTYFLWPLVMGVAFYAKGKWRELEEYVLALSLLYAVNFLGYALVPAVGPRFFLAEQFGGPLQGVFLTPMLDSLMRNPGFMRDCFPSGHTAVTLLVLAFAFRHERRLFALVLPFGAGLIAATVICRFHYAVDLIAALPLTLAALGVAGALASRVLGLRPAARSPRFRRSPRRRLDAARSGA